MESIGRRLTEAREAIGYTQAQLAERVPCNPQTVSNWETGRRQPRYADLLRLAEVLGRPVSWFLGEDTGPGLGEVQTGLARVRQELERIESLLARQPVQLQDGLVPVAGYLAPGPRAELVRQPVGWRLLSAAQASATVLEVRGDAHHPLLQEGDLVGIVPAEAAEPGRLVVVREPGGAEWLKRWGEHGQLETVNPLYAPQPAEGVTVVGQVAWQQRDYIGGGDAAASAAARLQWIEQAEREVDEVEARIERGDGQWTELQTLCETVVDGAALLRPVYGSRAAAPAARALARTARALGERGHYPEAQDAARGAAELFDSFERLGERSRDALNNLYNLSQLALFTGDLELAEGAAAQAAECPDWTVRWKALKNLAELRVNFRGEAFDDELGRDLLRLAEEQAAADPVQAAQVRAVAHEIRGNAWFTRGDAARARAEAEAELAAAEAAGLPYRLANALLNLAQYALAAGDAGAALTALQRVAPLTAAQDLGDLEALRRAHLAAAEAASGQTAAATVELHRALRLAATLGSPRATLAAELAGITVASATGNLAAREDHAAAARETARAMGLLPYLAVVDKLTEGA